jgi:DNA adenine methylase
MPEGHQHNHFSPLRYPGGKGKVANYIKLLFLRNGLVGHSYAEIYAGGASVAFALLFEEYASHIYINDLNRSIHAFWSAVLNDTELLCRLIRDTAITMEEWHRQKAVQLATNPDPLDLAFSTFFLNRTNRSGIILAGVIGGKNQSGAWKLDVRFNKNDLIQRIQKIARHRSRITLTRTDAAEYIRKELVTLTRDLLVYLDPPYYVKGEGLYEHSYTHENHAEIAGLVREIRQPYLVSYDAAPEILTLYKDWEETQYSLYYSAGERQIGSEVMFFSPGLARPDVPTPANVDKQIVHLAQRAVSSLFG